MDVRPPLKDTPSTTHSNPTLTILTPNSPELQQVVLPHMKRIRTTIRQPVPTKLSPSETVPKCRHALKRLSPASDVCHNTGNHEGERLTYRLDWNPNWSLSVIQWIPEGYETVPTSLPPSSVPHPCRLTSLPRHGEYRWDTSAIWLWPDGDLKSMPRPDKTSVPHNVTSQTPLQIVRWARVHFSSLEQISTPSTTLLKFSISIWLKVYRPTLS